MNDPASCVLDHLITALREVFSPTSPLPPVGGGTETVRLFAGDAIPLAAWDAHRDGAGCDQPFLWARLVRRYRSLAFPAPYAGPAPCGAPVVLAVEVGVGRCAVVDAEPSWEDYANEAEVSLDDSWRIELALCRAVSLVTETGCATSAASDAVLPYGPEGGVVAWIGTAYVQL